MDAAIVTNALNITVSILGRGTTNMELSPC